MAVEKVFLGDSDDCSETKIEAYINERKFAFIKISEDGDGYSDLRSLSLNLETLTAFIEHLEFVKRDMEAIHGRLG